MRPSVGWFAVAVLMAVAAACVPASVKGLIRQDDAKLSDTVRTGIQTSEEAVEETALGPYGFRVEWIAWDSGFRGTDLRIGDRIIGVDDHRYERTARKELAPHAVGGWAEPQYWEKRRARDGTRVTLHVWRRGKTLQVQGPLRADRFYYTPDKKTALGPGGPNSMASDGFSSAWSKWYEDQIRVAVQVLDGGLRKGSFNSRMLLDVHRGEKPRVDYLVTHYPGPFADAVKADWQRVHDVLLGPERTLTAKDLEYRTLGDQRAAAIKRIAGEARQRFVSRYEKQSVAPFPSIDPIHGDIGSIAGKVVVLPELGPRDWISEAGHGYLVAGDRQRGYYFIDSRSAPMKRVIKAQYLYQELVSPELRETYAIIGRVLPDPTLRVVGGTAVPGLAVEVLGATVGGAMFVDAQIVEDGESPFAGKETLSALGAKAPAEDASPRQVVSAAFEALKLGNQEAWARLFAPWHLSIYGPGRIYYDPTYYHKAPVDHWVTARRLILDRVYHVNVVDEGIVHRVTTGKEFPGAPVIEEVEVEVEHIGKFPEGYRPFTSVDVKRLWKLQRVNGGPWRIVTRRAI